MSGSILHIPGTSIRKVPKFPERAWQSICLEGESEPKLEQVAIRYVPSNVTLHGHVTHGIDGEEFQAEIVRRCPFQDGEAAPAALKSLQFRE